MDDIKIRVIDSKKLIEAINTGSYDINLSAVMALGAVATQPDIPDMNVIINAIENAINSLTGNETYMVGLRNGMRWCWSALTDKETEYEDIPSAPPRWIPVTERLPKKDGDYLVTTHSGQIARYIFIGGSSEKYWRRCATAWMPLPEPYKENKK